MIKLLFILGTFITSISFADTKFHYGDKVKFTIDFYGECHGYIQSTGNTRKLDCVKETKYEITDPLCNGKYAYRTFLVCESALVKDE
jgi:hypothetical protein